ncbi:MAG TPA: hypothetical protein VN085_05765 [Vicinamibacterales bacterium]|jgi:hypothetical protein|nr:hypothetical protein [Vicinamibacterales bacterium]
MADTRTGLLLVLGCLGAFTGRIIAAPIQQFRVAAVHVVGAIRYQPESVVKVSAAAR